MHDPRESPVLVLGSGQRCGSTLVQRLLGSHPEIMVWGEQGGALRGLLSMQRALEHWDAQLAAPARAAYDADGVDGWIANLLPGGEALRDAARAYLLTLFQAPAAERGKPRWGFKEVRFGSREAGEIRRLFPGVRVIHITRDPRDVLVSLDGWERAGSDWRREYTHVAVGDWVKVNESFREAGPCDWVLSCRYEDVLAAPGDFVRAVADLLDTEPGRFDLSVFDRRVRDYGDSRARLRRWDDLPQELHALLDDPQVRAQAAAYGYDLG